MGIEKNDNGQENGSMVTEGKKIYGQTNLRTNDLFNNLNVMQVVGVTGMAGVAQLVELWIVIPAVVGSRPIVHPN